nr:universal stress protein [Candidatus Sigynarchaeota archaeon]
MYEKVLFATDGSENAKRAEQRVIELAKSGNIIKTVVFHSILHQLIAQATPQQDIIPADIYQKILQEVEAYGRSILANSKEVFKSAGITVDTRLISDKSPEQYAIEAVKKEGFDIIVVGCKGHHSKIKEIVLGTVPTRILHGSRCDVLVVR